MKERGEDPSRLSTTELVDLVRAGHKHGVLGSQGAWPEYLQVAGKTSTKHLLDPARHGKEDLLGFVQSCLQPADKKNEESQAADPAVLTARKASARFVQRYMKWMQQATCQPDLGAVAGGTVMLDAEQMKIASLVTRTRAHAKFQDSYKLPSYTPGWEVTDRWGWGDVQATRLLAMDCEMCKTDVEENALLGVCIVDHKCEVVFKSLVRPKGNVLDYRTELTGVAEGDLKNINLTAKAARKAVQALLLPGTVLVGHALHHDLTALKIDYQAVIDTSMLFSYKSLPFCTPGLKDLAKLVLGLDMRDKGQHDAQEDASVAMQLVQKELQQEQPTPPLPPPEIKVSKEDLRKLFVHAMPSNVTEEDLAAVLAAAEAPEFIELEGNLAERRAYMVFKHAGDANVAFSALRGNVSKDSTGRATKLVQLSTGGTIKVRKMACHNGLAFGKIKRGDKVQQAQEAKRPKKKKKTQ